LKKKARAEEARRFLLVPRKTEVARMRGPFKYIVRHDELNN
jgi:hypothetical protein